MALVFGLGAAGEGLNWRGGGGGVKCFLKSPPRFRLGGYAPPGTGGAFTSLIVDVRISLFTFYYLHSIYVAFGRLANKHSSYHGLIFDSE